MTKDGVVQTIMTMVAAYPNFHPADMQSSVKVWGSQLEDYSDEEVAVALKAFILSDTRGFAPSIGQIVALIPRNQDDGMSELAAWGLVEKAIRNGGYGAEEEYAKLPVTVQIAIGSPGQIRDWAFIDSDELPTVAQSNFLRSYRTVVAREKMAKKLPQRLRELYSRIPQHSAPKLDTKAQPAAEIVTTRDDDGRLLALPRISGGSGDESGA